MVFQNKDRCQKKIGTTCIYTIELNLFNLMARFKNN